MTVATHTTTGPGSAHRERLVAAMAELVAEQGYPTVTVTDVVARAHVSKRTFYQHFAEREDCFLATYAALAEEPLRRIAEVAGDPAVRGLDLRDQVTRATGAYLEAMAEQPSLTRALLTEIASTGPRGREVRRRVLLRFADQLAELVHAGGADGGAEPAVLSRPTALALVGGINELVLQAVDGPVDDVVVGTGPETDTAPLGGHPPDPEVAAARVVALAGTVTDLVVAVLRRGA